jgi:GMP synthase (glutamine-hydrolysing)
MRVLIVNNGKHYPARIAALFRGATIEVVKAADVPEQYAVATHDLIVLSGSNSYPIPYFTIELTPLLTWIRAQTQPLLGICYGAELLAVAYGGTLRHLGIGNKRKGFYTYSLPDTSLPLPDPLCVYEGHQWVITTVPAPLYPILVTKSQILMFGHATLPHRGIIFHLEKFPHETDSLQVYNVIMEEFGLF